MKYKLLQKKQGVNPKAIQEFESENKILDVLNIDTKTIILDGKHVKIVDGNGSENFIDFEFCNATSFAYSQQTERIFVADCGGRLIWAINFQDREIIQWISGNAQKFMLNELRKQPQDLPVSISVDNNEKIYISPSNKNKIYVFKDSDIYHYAGNGKRGYSVSDAKNSMFSNIKDIFVNNNCLYVADYNNKCIRRIHDNSVELVCGHPINGDINPSKITICRNTMYFVSNNVYTFNIDNWSVGIRPININCCLSDILVSGNFDGSICIIGRFENGQEI